MKSYPDTIHATLWSVDASMVVLTSPAAVNQPIRQSHEQSFKLPLDCDTVQRFCAAEVTHHGGSYSLLESYR
jgi:hypothetical protein